MHFLKVLTLGRHYTCANHLTTCRLQLMATMAHFLRSAFGCRRSTCQKKEIHNLFFSCADCCARDSLYIFAPGSLSLSLSLALSLSLSPPRFLGTGLLTSGFSKPHSFPCCQCPTSFGFRRLIYCELQISCKRKLSGTHFQVLAPKAANGSYVHFPVSH